MKTPFRGFSEIDPPTEVLYCSDGRMDLKI